MVTYDMNEFHIPDENKPKNLYFAYNCGICDKKIPKNNLYCYACRKEYQISSDGIFKYNIQSFEKKKNTQCNDTCRGQIVPCVLPSVL